MGPVGSGKTSLLMAMLGELQVTAGSLRVAAPPVLSSQSVRVLGSVNFWRLIQKHANKIHTLMQAWIMNTTVRDNVVFGHPYDEAWYMRVVSACQLLPDVAGFVDGHDTEVGVVMVVFFYLYARN